MPALPEARSSSADLCLERSPAAGEPSIAHLALELLFLDGRFLYKPGKSVPGVLELDALLPNLSDPSRIDTSPDNFVALAELVRAETPRSLPTVLRTLSVLAALPAPAGAPARAAFEALEQTLQLNEQAWRVEAAQKKSPPGLVPVHKALVAAMSPGSPSASLSLVRSAFPLALIPCWELH